MNPIFPYITSASELPGIGVREGPLLDFKGRVDAEPDSECGKDISAFANASGGALLIGAAEDSRRGELSGWIRDKGSVEAFSAEEGHSLVKRYSNVSRDLCEPVPFIHATTILLNSGRYLVAINVRPQITGHAVGVRTRRTEKPMVDVWAFFHRVGTDNLDVGPAELPMLMIPQLRRVVILLGSIPDPKVVVVVDSNGNVQKGCISLVSEIQNIFVVTGSPTRTFPLDAVKTAYATPDGTTWRIILDVAWF